MLANLINKIREQYEKLVKIFCQRDQNCFKNDQLIKQLEKNIQEQRRHNLTLYQVISNFQVQKSKVKKLLGIHFNACEIQLNQKQDNKLKNNLSSSLYVSIIEQKCDQILKLKQLSIQQRKAIYALVQITNQSNQQIKTLNIQIKSSNKRLTNLQQISIHNNLKINKLKQQLNQQVDKNQVLTKENSQYKRLNKRWQRNIQQLTSKVKYLQMDVQISDLLKNHTQQQKIKLKQQVQQIRLFFNQYEKQFKMFNKYNKQLNSGCTSYKYSKWRSQQIKQNEQQHQKYIKLLKDNKIQLEQRMLKIIQNEQFNDFLDRLQWSNITASSNSCYSLSQKTKFNILFYPNQKNGNQDKINYLTNNKIQIFNENKIIVIQLLVYFYK